MALSIFEIVTGTVIFDVWKPLNEPIMQAGILKIKQERTKNEIEILTDLVSNHSSTSIRI